MVKKFYAVRNGKKTGIFESWDECKMQVNGYPCAEYKSFKTKEEAQIYLGGSVKAGREDENISGVKAYVDGSFHSATKEFSYGMILLLENGEELKFAEKYNDKELAAMHNVAGEIKGAEAAMKYALDHGLPKITIYHDYEGIAKWCLGDWKTNKEGTKAYKKFYDSIREKVDISFVKVTGHSNDKYNDIADELAKQALGIIEEKHTLEN